MKNKRSGSKTRFIISSIAICLTAFLSQAESDAAQTVYDTFLGDRINQTLWKVFDDGSVLSVSGGSLNASTPPNYSYGNMGSTHTFRGDFSFILTYKNFHTTASSFQGNCPEVSLQVSDASNGNGDFVFIFRGHCQNGPVFFSNASLNGSWHTGFDAPAGSSGGSLKIKRNSRTITTYCNEGSGWTQVGRFDNAFDSDVTVQVGSYTGDNGDFGVSMTALTYSGNMVKPAAVSGCIKIKDSALAGATVKLKQQDVLPQTAKTNAEGCYEFKEAVPGKPFTLTISGTAQ